MKPVADIQGYTKKRRRSRLNPSSGPTKILPLSRIERANEILRLLDQRLFASNDQIETLLFDGRPTRTGKPRSPKGAEYAANAALRALWDAGYIERVWCFLPSGVERFKQHYVNILTTQGSHAVEADYEARGRGEQVRWRRHLAPKPFRPLVHPFHVNDTLITVMKACQTEPWQCWQVLDDRQLSSLRLTHGFHFKVIPDGFFIITNHETGKDYPHFLEVDLGTESVRAEGNRPDWQGKIEGYVEYLRFHYETDFADLATELGLVPKPVVLTVTTAQARLENLLRATTDAGGGGWFWYTTLEQLKASPDAFWERIWHVAGEDTPRSLLHRCGA